METTITKCHISLIMGDINSVTKKCVTLLSFPCPFFILLLQRNYKHYNVLTCRMLQNNHFAILLGPFYKLRCSIIVIGPLKVKEIGNDRLTPG